MLGIFDSASLPAADVLLPTVAEGIAEVAPLIPYDWSRSVVVYALSDTGYLASIPDLPGGDAERLDGAAFPVFARPQGGQVASTRFALHPRLLVSPGPDRDRLVRHELTHVALGERDDHVPVWLGEGLAEYVSVRALDPQDRQIAEAAVDRAVVGVRDLPADDAFDGDQSRAHYGLAWWVCEYLADSYGEPVLWQLLDALAPTVGSTDDSEAVLRDLTGLTSHQLARKGAKLLVRTYAPEELETAAPTPSGSASGTGGPSDPASPGEDPAATRSSSAQPGTSSNSSSPDGLLPGPG